MSAFTTSSFGELAPLLTAYGYHCVPVKPGTKSPDSTGWQTGHPPEHYLPRCAQWGTGILTATCPAVDLDIRDREIVRQMIALAGEVLGPTPFRVGARPKALMPFSTSTPFGKITGRWFALPHDDYGRDDFIAHRVEILCGGQFLAYARHPRGTFYRWRRGEPMDTPLIDLPEIDESAAKRFLWAAHDIARDVRALPLRKEEDRWWPASWEPEDFGEETHPWGGWKQRHSPGGRSDRSWQKLDPEELAKRIDKKHAARLKNGGWITACPAHKSQGGRSLSITPRDGGGSVVHCFGECSFGDVAKAISNIVGRAA
jgi:hypothetical protein